MKIQKCYSLDNRIVSALSLLKTSQNPKAASLLVERFVKAGIISEIENIKSPNVRAEVIELVEAYEATAG